MSAKTGEVKKGNDDIYIFSAFAVFIVIVSLWFGYVLEMTEDNGIQWAEAFASLPMYANVQSFGNAVSALVNGSGTTRISLVIGIAGAGLVMLYRMIGNGKRYHRKGVEHGSARWGTKAEKDIISDTRDFYNNVIAASDVFLVLNRKDRETNEKAEKEKKLLNRIIRIITIPFRPIGSFLSGIVNAVGSFISGIFRRKQNSRPANEKMTLKQVSSMKRSSQKIKPMLNLNMMIIGGSGTGKSRFYVKPNLMQCNTSFVVTDPSGELLQSCGKMLERMGYKIKVFNVNDMKHSSNYNPFHYLKDSSGQISNNNVIKMINVFMMNTKGEGANSGGDPFWDDATKLLLSAICFLVIETGTEEEQNFSNVLDLIHKASVSEDENGKNKEKSELDLIFEQYSEINPKALSVQYYEEFKQAAGKTMQSILISTTTKLQHFKLEDVRNLTFTDNIHLETMGDEKTALFIIIPSTDTTYNFLAAMMYTQLFDTLYDRAIIKYHGSLPVHVSFILDEFANVGKIPEFEKVLATCRKFEISAVVILQSISQLKRLYEKSWQELPGNCDTIIFLGGKDQFTNEYLSKELGKETIDTLSINKTKSKQGSTSYNDGILGRELLTIDELGTMDNNDCIVMVRGLHPFYTAKFDISNHPRYKMLDEADKENNTFYLEKNIFTVRETEIIDFTEFYEGKERSAAEKVEIRFIGGDKADVSRYEDIMSDIPDEIRDKFRSFGDIYSMA